MKSNHYRKLTREDKFYRYRWCKNSALRYIRHQKRANRKRVRQLMRKEEENE